MKRKYLLLFLMLPAGVICYAQQTNPAKKTAVSRKEVTPKVYSAVSPGMVQSSLVEGKVTLYKSFLKDPNSDAFKLVYTMLSSNSNSPASEKPVEIKLTKEYFETVFLRSTTDIANKSAYLNKFVQDKKLTLSDEKSWISVIGFYNDL